MRLLIIISLLILCSVACSTIEVQTRAPYQSSEFRSSDLETGGVALLPVTKREFDSIIQ